MSKEARMKFAVRAITNLVILVFVTGLATHSSAQETKQSDEAKSMKTEPRLFWIFLNAGKSTEGVDSEKVQEMQREHLANFKKLAEEEKLLTAGPLTDPEKKMRGIVIVRAQSKSVLKEFFQTDPFVQQGYLSIEAIEMNLELGDLNAKINPQGLEEYRLVVFERNGDQNSDATEPVSQSEKQDSYGAQIVAQLAKDKDVLLGASFSAKSGPNRHAVIVFAKPEDDEAIAKKVQDIPVVKSGLLRHRLFPLFMGKGTFKQRVPSE